jgi:hypothetical protein
MKIPFFFGLEIDLIAVIVFIFTMIIATNIIKWIIKTTACYIEKKYFHDAYKLDLIEKVIETDGWKLAISWIVGWYCFSMIVKYSGKLPITDGSTVIISAWTIIQYMLFTALTRGGFKLLKPVIMLWIEQLKNKFFKKGE